MSSITPVIEEDKKDATEEGVEQPSIEQSEEKLPEEPLKAEVSTLPKNQGHQKRTPSSRIDEFKEYIKSFSLSDCKFGSQGYERVLLQLFGLLGNGKSSFINSCKFVLGDEEYVNYTKASESAAGNTTKRVPFKITDTITMVDNRGMSKLADHETGQIYAQLSNLLPIDEEVEWCKDYEKNVDILMDENKTPNYSDFIVPIFVHSVNCIIPHQEIQMYKMLLENARKLTGVTPLILLTHMSAGGFSAMRACFEDMGIKRNKIFAVENYTENDHEVLMEKHEEILSFLRRVLEDVDFSMRKTRDRVNERYDRMKIVLRHLHKIGNQ